MELKILKDVIFEISRNRNPQTEIAIDDADNTCIYIGFPILSAVIGMLNEKVEVSTKGCKTTAKLVRKASDKQLQESFEGFQDFCDDFE